MTGKGLLVAGALVAASLAPARAEGDPGAVELRVLSFNIRYGTADDGANAWEHRREQVFDVLRKSDCAIVCLQEALHFQLAEIQEAVPGYTLIGAGRDDGRQKGEYSAILYRADAFTEIESRTYWLSDTPKEPGSKSWGNRIPRICTWALLRHDASKRLLNVLNTHWDHESQESREKSAELIVKRSKMRGARAPLILCGDFNAGETNKAMVTLRGEERGPGMGTAAVPPLRLADTFRAVHPDETRDGTRDGTFHGWKGARDGPRVDAILTTAALTVLDAWIDRSSADGRYPSDHFPVGASVRLGTAGIYPLGHQVGIGDTRAAVEKRLGKPSDDDGGTHYAKLGLWLHYGLHDRVRALLVEGDAFTGKVLGVALGTELADCAAVWGRPVMDSPEFDPPGSRRVTYFKDGFQIVVHVGKSDDAMRITVLEL